MTHEELTEIVRRSAHYKPKKTQPDATVFRDDVVKLLTWIRAISHRADELHKEIKL